MTKKIVIMGLFSGFFMVLPFRLSAQTAVKLETLLNETALSWSTAAVFVLEASDTGAYSDPSEAFSFAQEHKWLPKNVSPEDSARLNGIALLLMRSFDQKGGLFYSIAKSPHHAYRELAYKGVIRGKADPDMSVSGQELLLMIGRLLDQKEQTELQAVQ